MLFPEEEPKFERFSNFMQWSGARFGFSYNGNESYPIEVAKGEVEAFVEVPWQNNHVIVSAIYWLLLTCIMQNRNDKQKVFQTLFIPSCWMYYSNALLSWINCSLTLERPWKPFWHLPVSTTYIIVHFFFTYYMSLYFIDSTVVRTEHLGLLVIIMWLLCKTCKLSSTL